MWSHKQEVPAGDWFCDRCRPKERPKSPRKKRQIYSEDSDDEEVEEEYSDVCYTCCTPGTLICCDTCPLAFHPECVALRKVPRGSWSCPQCTDGNSKGKDSSDDKKKNEKEVSKGGKEGGRNKSTPKANTPKAISNTTSNKSSTPKANNSTTPKTNSNSAKKTSNKTTPKTTVTPKSGSRGSPRNQKSNSPLPTPDNNNTSSTSSSSSRKRKMNDAGIINSASKRTKKNIDESPPSRRSSGRRSVVDENCSLNVDALTSLLEELQQHPDSCHFNKPVSKKLAPDYYDVVRKPMDLGSVRNKLASLKYNSDEEFLADVMLVFQNCQQYNFEDTPEYKAGSVLSDLFFNQVSKFGLPLPPSFSPSSVVSNSSRRRRR